MISKNQLVAGLENALNSGRFSRQNRTSNKENQYRPETTIQKVHYQNIFCQFLNLHSRNLNFTSRHRLIYETCHLKSQEIQDRGIRK